MEAPDPFRLSNRSGPRGLVASAGVVTSIVAALAASPPALAGEGDRVILDNGVTLLLRPVPEADQVAIETFYRVGFIDEPAGMTQAAHLLEHLVCNAATASYGANEAMRLLGEVGMANAETLPSWTHYDYGVPADKLELAIKIEAERLTSLKIDKSVVVAEAPRCYQETDFVERNPAGGMVKHAFMAMAQGWRHRRDTALVRGGLEEFSLESFEKFRQQYYRPGNLTVIVIGRFERDAAVELAKKHLGGIANHAARPTPIDWAKVPREQTVRWDAKLRTVCLAFPPPADRFEAAVLSTWGAAIGEGLSHDADLSRLATMVMVSNHMWSVGELPFFVYAAAKPDADVDELARVLAAKFRALAADPLAGGLASVHGIAAFLSQQTQAQSWPAIQQMARSVAQHRGGDEKIGLGMVLGQGAINWGVAELFTGGDPTFLPRLSAVTEEQIRATVARHLAAERQIVTRLVPRGAD